MSTAEEALFHFACHESVSVWLDSTSAGSERLFGPVKGWKILGGELNCS